MFSIFNLFYLLETSFWKYLFSSLPSLLIELVGDTSS